LRDKDLAELYDLETRRLKVDVRKNVKLFQTDFMHEKLTTKNYQIGDCKLRPQDSGF